MKLTRARTARRPVDPTARGGVRLLAGGALAAVAAALVAAPGGGPVEAAAPPGGTAVVALAGPTPVTVPGVRLVAAYPAVHAELVRGSAAALGRLARRPEVRGLSPDAPGVVAGHDFGGRGQPAPAGHLTGPAGHRIGPQGQERGLLAARTVGGDAGEPGAGRGVTVALLDTGVSDTPALDRASGRLVDGVDTSGDGGAAPYDDGFGHGTFLASLIAGGPVPGTGRLGVGVAPGATVDVVKVADAQGRTSLSRVLAGLGWVARNADRIDVVSIALSVQRPRQAYGADPLTTAVELVRRAGVSVVAAAGNVAGQVGDPGLDPRAFTVGAADTEGEPSVAPFSGSGVVAGVAKPDVVAPGMHLLGEMPQDTMVWRQHPEGRDRHDLFRGSGTSEATAVTAGVTALFLADHPHASPADVKASLRSAARPLPGDRDGAGLLRPTERLVAGGTDAQPSAATGETTLDAGAWDSPETATWVRWLANSWDANSWDANSWDANSWDANSWDANSWDANSWDANSWDANSWDANSWDANSWDSWSWGDRR